MVDSFDAVVDVLKSSEEDPVRMGEVFEAAEEEETYEIRLVLSVDELVDESVAEFSIVLQDR